MASCPGTHRLGGREQASTCPEPLEGERTVGGVFLRRAAVAERERLNRALKGA